MKSSEKEFKKILQKLETLSSHIQRIFKFDPMKANQADHVLGEISEIKFLLVMFMKELEMEKARSISYEKSYGRPTPIME